jgi:hypothetical protein
MARTEEDFEKGEADGTSDAQAVIPEPAQARFYDEQFLMGGDE